MPFNEQDDVRIRNAISSEDAYVGRHITVEAGKVGTIVRGAPGQNTYDVEFTLKKANGTLYNAVLIIPFENLEAV